MIPRRPLKVREVIRLIENDGWYHVRTTGSHRQFRHPTKSGIVTVAGKPGTDVPKGTLKSILKQSRIRWP
jgi:predicted RNA binding protein YcfA (HicA-like mRNA interferase family)